jgi:hypothetical protein
MKNILIILIALISFTGCVTEKRCNSKFPTEVMIIRKDSIITEKETIFRDTTIFIRIPGENQYYTDTIYIKDGQLYFKPSHLRTSFAESRAWIENGHIRHTLTQNDTIISVRIKDAIRLTWERAEKYFTKDQTRIVEIKVIPKWVQIFAFLGAATIGYLIFRVARLLKM